MNKLKPVLYIVTMVIEIFFEMNRVENYLEVQTVFIQFLFCYERFFSYSQNIMQIPYLIYMYLAIACLQSPMTLCTSFVICLTHYVNS